ncbi:hypothetical protein CARUB_v10007602mg [Capsella rubella]|uniref:Aspergillus nuclease S1 n=1 Tax=Capsella rubella TaxID=81985 RepID=R0FAD2_9BRAS|nr:hypothetical protein CARUB_v10007602mg [Capsella rubella]
MEMRLSLWFASVVVLTQLVCGALCWGKEGHYTVCKIAEGYFEDVTIAAVRKLLPESAEGDLASFCSWPDEIKHLSQWKWTSVLHYVNTPEYRCNYEYCRDCHDANKHKDLCVTGAIFNYTNQLMSASENSQRISHFNLTEALMFISHYIGDVHQSMCLANVYVDFDFSALAYWFSWRFRCNNIIVKWYHHKTTLHHVWDNMIIESALETYYNSSLPRMIQALQAKLKNGWSNDIPLWESCQFNQKACPNQYASESIDLACKYAYRNATPGTTLGDDYFLSRLPIVEKRLAQGGIRLAATLNRIFSVKPKLARS